MQTGELLVDVNRGEARFRVKDLLFDGANYQIALAEDTELEDKLVCVKTIAYDPERLDDKKYVAMRRKALHEELRFLARPIHLLPEPLDWIQVAESETVLGREPLLVYEYIHGQTLHELVTQRFPEGLAPARALRIFREIVVFLANLHRGKFVYRNLDPRHIIVGYDDVIHLVGCGNATPMSEPPNLAKGSGDSAYVAPEIRDETSGKLLRPTADLYSAGALLSFLLTGEEPRDSVENPLSQVAYDRLTAIQPPGLALIVARCINPLTKQRIARAEKLLPFCRMETLPTPKSEGFGVVQLPAPWSGAERPDSRAANSKISTGPLISVPNDQLPEKQAEPRPSNPFIALMIWFKAFLIRMGFIRRRD